LQKGNQPPILETLALSMLDIKYLWYTVETKVLDIGVGTFHLRVLDDGEHFLMLQEGLGIRSPLIKKDTK
jgi:hypothetical protein